MKAPADTMTAVVGPLLERDPQGGKPIGDEVHGANTHNWCVFRVLVVGVADPRVGKGRGPQTVKPGFWELSRGPWYKKVRINTTYGRTRTEVIRVIS